jgi:hypothetical protein
LQESYDGLAALETRHIQMGDSYVLIQHNPWRIRSTAAPVDDASVRARGCFLCPENLPSPEKGIAYQDLVFLCNPFPILDRHLSIVTRNHDSQVIKGHLDALMVLARELSPDYFLLYNGPECGASAPDHLHFQACRLPLLPIEETVRRGDSGEAESCRLCDFQSPGTFEIFTIQDCNRTVIVFRGGDEYEVANWVYRVLGRLAGDSPDREPMINLICRFEAGRWSVYLFPRSRHRPSCFYLEEARRVMISPGAIDMAGVLVIPERGGFERATADLIEQVFAEVSSNYDVINELMEELCRESGTGFNGYIR